MKSNNSSSSTCSYNGWLDKIAISMSVICAIHCLVTPILVITLPVLATTFWVNHNFHLWMIGLVVPTTSMAIISGCKKHKDKHVVWLSVIGLLILILVALYESFFHSSLVYSQHSNCYHCTEREFGSIFNSSVLLNIIGGIILSTAHVRNFLLCRKSKCSHNS